MPPEGLGENPETLKNLCRDNDEAMRALQKELGKELGNPGGVNNPDGRKGKKNQRANGTLIKGSKRGSNKSDYLLSRLKRDVPEAVKGGRKLRDTPGAPEGSRNNPMGRAGKTNCVNNTISKKGHGSTNTPYLTARLKRDNPEILYRHGLFENIYAPTANWLAKDWDRMCENSGDGILPNHIYYAMPKPRSLNIPMSGCVMLKNPIIRADKNDVC